MNPISMIKQLARDNTLRLVILAAVPLASVSVASAETVAKRLSCVTGNYTRMIELVYEGPGMSLPCIVRQQKQGQQAGVLWRARFQSNYCDEKIESYRDKLSTAGFSCEWLPGDQHSAPVRDGLASQLAVYRSEPIGKHSLSDVVSWTTILQNDDGGDITPVSEAPDDDNKLQQNTTGVTQLSSESYLEINLHDEYGSINDDSPLAGSLQQQIDDFSAFSETEMSRDDWIIYLSAKSLAGINDLLVNEPGLFERYLRFERQNTDNIYSQLQLRIHHLAAIAGAQQRQTGSNFSSPEMRLE